MSIDERYTYLGIMQERYAVAKRKPRGELLDEMEAITGLDRKTLIRHMRVVPQRRKRARQRGRKYGPAVEDALSVIAESMDYIAAERLQPNLVSISERLAAHGELELTEELRGALGKMSVCTVRRTLQRMGQADARRVLRKPVPQHNHVASSIPAKRIPWNEPEPGHFEVDLVHHGDPVNGRDYVHTLQLVDVATGWSERVAILGRSGRVMEDAFRRMLARLPFPVREIHPDNGSEFLNHHLVRFWGASIAALTLSRSRPWFKNDNRFVEQKNRTLVRAFLGREHLDSVAQTRALNSLYDQLWLYNNLFQPVMRLADKTTVPTQDHTYRIHRRFDQAATPFDRLCATGAISAQDRLTLETLRDTINPRALRRNVYDLLDTLMNTPGATPGVTENVLATLNQPILSWKGEDRPVTFSFERKPVSSDILI